MSTMFYLLCYAVVKSGVCIMPFGGILRRESVRNQDVPNLGISPPPGTEGWAFMVRVPFVGTWNVTLRSPLSFVRLWTCGRRSRLVHHWNFGPKNYNLLSPSTYMSDTVAKWLKHSTVDQKVPGSNLTCCFTGKCFFYTCSSLAEKVGR